MNTYRAIVRFSLDGDDGTYTTKFRSRFQVLGFQKIGTSTWNNDTLPEANLAQLADLLRDITNVSGISAGKVKLDHIWSYVDIPHSGAKI